MGSRWAQGHASAFLRRLKGHGAGADLRGHLISALVPLSLRYFAAQNRTAFLMPWPKAHPCAELASESGRLGRGHRW